MVFPGVTFATFAMKTRAMAGGVFPTLEARASLDAPWDASGVFAFTFTMRRLVRMVGHKSRAGIFTMNFRI